jgi:uncharacterized phage-associated protein
MAIYSEAKRAKPFVQGVKNLQKRKISVFPSLPPRSERPIKSIVTLNSSCQAFFMATANDIAAYIIQKHGPISAMKFQKLLYYSQAWALVWDEKPLFQERIEAWINGPVIPDIYELHKGQFQIENWPLGDPQKLNAEQIETVDAVFDFYGDKTAQWLSDLTHREKPWQEARKGLDCNERGNREITKAALHEYYSSL